MYVFRVFVVATAGLLHAQDAAQYEFLEHASRFCRNLRYDLPVVRRDSQSRNEEIKTPGPVQTAPWYLGKAGVLASPRDTIRELIPENLYINGTIRQRNQTAINGRILKTGEAIWMTESSCSSAPIDLSQTRGVFINMTFVTQNAFEIIRDGNSTITPFIFTVRIPLGELVQMTGDKLAAHLESLLSTNSIAVNATTIRLGQTRQDVESILGAPERIFDAGPKVIYSYKSVKVTFVNGRVSDIE